MSGLRLTRRQEEILGLVAQGLADKEIASRLGISVKTVRTHLDRLFLEAGIRNRAQAVALWLSRVERGSAPEGRARRKS